MVILRDLHEKLIEKSVWVDNDPCTILRGTNSNSTWKWMVGRLKFPFGKAYFQGLCYIDLGRVSIKHVMPSNVFCSMNTYHWKDFHEANICFDSWNMWFPLPKHFRYREKIVKLQLQSSRNHQNIFQILEWLHRVILLMLQKSQNNNHLGLYYKTPS